MDAMDTLLNPNFTYHLDKISCMKGAYFAHVIFCYLVFLSGIACFSVRAIPMLKWTHAWFGRVYIICMLWATATSLLIHNSGLPPATLISFVWTLGGMCIAWVLIQFHTIKIDRLAFERVQKEIAVNGLQGVTDLRARIAAEKGRIAASKTVRQRMISIKAAHGMIMFVSWMNIAGRIFASDQSGDFTCHTYPVYKPINTKHFQGANSSTLTTLPARDPRFDRLPWAKTGLAGWGAAMLLGPLVGAIIIGVFWSMWEAKRVGRKATKTTPLEVASPQLSNTEAQWTPAEKERVIDIRKSVEIGVVASA